MNLLFKYVDILTLKRKKYRNSHFLFIILVTIQSWKYNVNNIFLTFNTTKSYFFPDHPFISKIFERKI